MLVLKPILSLSFCFFIISFSNAQSTYKSIFSNVGEFSDAGVTADGSFIAVGSSGNAEIVKLSKDGILQWTTSLENDEISFVRDVAINQDGDIFVLGHVNISGIGSIVIFKLNENGIYQGSKRLFHSSTNSGWDIVADGNNGVFVLGGGCNGDNFVLHLDQELEIVWQRGYSVLLAANGHTIEPLQNGNFLIGGSATNTDDGTRPFQIFEINPDGELLWSRVFEGYSLGQVVRFIELDNGELAMLYYAKLDPNQGTHIFVTRMGADGTPIWTKILMNEWEQARDFVELKDGGLMLVGYNRIVGDGDAMIAKLSGNGDLEFVRNIPGQLFNSNGQQYINKILPICEDKFAVFGFLDGMMAAFVNEKGDGFCESSDVAVDEFDVVDHDLRELDFFVIQSPLTFQELNFDVTVKYDFLIENNFCSFNDPSDPSCMTSSIAEKSDLFQLNVVPNPTSDFLMLDYEMTAQQSVDIVDLNGRLVMSDLSNIQRIDISQLLKGVYFLRLKTPSKEYVERFVKQ